MADNETGISPNTPMQDLIGQMNYQAAQSAVGLNLSKQMSNQLSAINMNIGKTTAAMNRVDSNIGNLLNMQKSMNMNIGKVNASVNALGKKYDDTNKILSDILKSASKGGVGDQYQSLENKLETKDVSNNIQSMTDSLKSIDETLKKMGGISSSSSNNSNPTPNPSPQPSSWMNWGKLGLTALGAGLTYSGYNTLSNNQSPNLFGDEKTGWMGSRASGYAQTILGGGLAGTLGGPIGMALGMGAGILTARNTDPQLKNYNGVFGPLKDALPQSSDPAYVKQLNDSYEKTTKFKWTRDGKYWIKDTQRGDWAEISREQWEAGVNQAKTLGIKPDIEIEPFTANKDAGPVWERYGRVGPNTTAMDMAVAGDIMNRNANKPMPSPSSAVSGTNDSKEFTGQPPKTIEKKTETEPVSASPVDDSSEPFLPVPYLPSDSSTASYVEPKDSILPEVPPTGLVVGTMGAKEALDQQQATIDQKSKDMTKSTLSYEATDVLYKATNIKFEASSIQFTGAMGGAGGGAIPRDSSVVGGAGGGGSSVDYDGRHGGSGTSSNAGGSPGNSSLPPEARKASEQLQSSGTFKVNKGGDDPFSKYSEEDLRKQGVVSHTNTDGTKVYSYSPGGIGSHADKIGGSGATQEVKPSNLTPREQEVIKMIQKREGVSGDVGYDMILGDKKGKPGSSVLGAPPKPISQMTLSELYKWQTDMLNNPNNRWNSSAVGAGQFIRTTLFGKNGQPGLLQQMGIDPKDYDKVIFDKALQDRATIENFRRNVGDPNDPSTWNRARLGGQWQSFDTGAGFRPLSQAEVDRVNSASPERPTNTSAPSAKAPNLGDQIQTLTPMSAVEKTNASSATDIPTPQSMSMLPEENKSVQVKDSERNSAAIQRTEALRREQARVENRNHSDKKREDARVQQMKENRDSHAPKNPVPSKRRELDSVLVRHNDWWKNWSATA